MSKQTDREDQSRIEIVSGGKVQFAGGSLTLATGGQIAVSATSGTFAASGSILDVAGAVGVSLTMASNSAVVNVSALTNASAAATQAALAAQDVVSRERTAARQALPSLLTVRVLGFGDDPATGDDAKPAKSGTVGYDTKGRCRCLGRWS